MLFFVTRWTPIAKVLPDRVRSVLILFPFVGHVILFNEPVVKFLASLHETFSHRSNVCAVFNFPGTVSIEIFYYGLFSIGCCSLIFSIFCPAEIKNYKSAQKFRRDYPELRTSQQVILHYAQHLEQVHLPTKAARAAWRRLQTCVDELNALPETKNDSEINRRISEYKINLFLLYDETKIAGPICFLLYSVGLILTAIPSVVVFFLITCNNLSSL